MLTSNPNKARGICTVLLWGKWFSVTHEYDKHVSLSSVCHRKVKTGEHLAGGTDAHTYIHAWQQNPHQRDAVIGPSQRSEWTLRHFGTWPHYSPTWQVTVDSFSWQCHWGIRRVNQVYLPQSSHDFSLWLNLHVPETQVLTQVRQLIFTEYLLSSRFCAELHSILSRA